VVAAALVAVSPLRRRLLEAVTFPVRRLRRNRKAAECPSLIPQWGACP